MKKRMDNEYKLVYDILVNERIPPDIENISLKKALEIAKLNKAELEFLRKLEIKNRDRIVMERKNNRILSYIEKISRTLGNIEFVFFKIRKPLSYVPSDIDLLIDKNSIGNALNRLKKMGFHIEIIEPYCVTLKKQDIIIDMYVNPTFANIIYIEGEKLLEHKSFTTINEIEIPVLTKYAESVMTISHSIYKERIFTLNDYMTVKKWFNKRALELAYDTKVIEAVRFAFFIIEFAEKHQLKLPYKLPTSLWLFIFKNKVVFDKVTRSSLIRSSRLLFNEELGKKILNNLKRKSY